MTNLEVLLLKGSKQGDPAVNLEDLRYEVLVNGVPSKTDGMSELRIYVWLILLNAAPIATNIYLDLVRLGASASHQKIMNDVFRTFPQDPLYKRRVTDNSLCRVLNAMAWKLIERHESGSKGWRSPETASITGDTGSPDNSFLSKASGKAADSRAGESNTQIGYKQGMNVLAGTLLYAAKSEGEAFVAFEKLVTKECPGYIRSTMDGVHKGLELVDEILKICDPKLSAYLLSKHMNANIYAFASVLTLSACTPPLPEVLKLWDFLFAYGPHLNLVCIVAQLVLIRDKLLASNSPNTVLRSMPNLQAEKIKALTISFIPKIPDELYERILNHAK